MADAERLAYRGDVDPTETWRSIVDNSGSYLVDVRTGAEWTFVGLPDLSEASKPVWRIEWKMFPTMAHNPRFYADLAQNVAAVNATDLYFLCRSGQRSHEAASIGLEAPELRALERPLTFYNVAGGFEGRLDPKTGHRGVVDGWKSDGLPWRQG